MSPDWQSTMYDTPNRTRYISSEIRNDNNSINTSLPSRLRISNPDLAKQSLDDTDMDIERGELSPVVTSTLRTELPLSPDITPSPTKRWSTSTLGLTMEETSPTKSKRGSPPQAFRFGLPGATGSTQDLQEYPFHAQPSEVELGYTSNARLFNPHSGNISVAQQEKVDDHLAIPTSIKARSLTENLPARRTLRRYILVLIGCMVFIVVARLFSGLLNVESMGRHQVRYVDTLGRDKDGSSQGQIDLASTKVKATRMSQQHLAPDYQSDAEKELLQFEAEMRKGSDWAWKPSVKAQEGLYLLDELEEDDNDAHFQRSRTEEEYEEIERQISKSNVFSSLTSVQARSSRGRPESRLDGLKIGEVLKLRQLEERNRIASLRALVAFIGGGAEFPESWIEEGAQGQTLTTMIGKAWVDVDGNGLERGLKKLLGKRGASEVFPRGWKADMDDHTKLVVFSKSYCPYSRHLRRILDDYNITPSPYYIQVDRREDGPIIQALLQEFTSRSTIPTVLLNSHSIGGSDELQLAAAEGSMARIFTREGLRVTKKYE
ncbi:hypothetical protein HD553DRAFT_343905 [Filobasidium floriforme]|uniref:uncharacterized protein n=1 Tax=Filobasidium floriforme TaxID=5210 RepID=UPI001E8CE6F9|nr:uncharacterized protein HD553DRAFT_343905 [Filobasidium floriforme]KAH8081834.1 hypothetical protein HD553DRAFT_343905 [Filobasidium floriforme]